MKFKKLAAGFYEAPDGTTVEHRPDLDGDWYVTYPERSFPDDVYPTLGDARDALAQRDSDRLTEALLEWTRLHRKLKRGDFGSGSRFDRAVARVEELEQEVERLGG